MSPPSAIEANESATKAPQNAQESAASATEPKVKMPSFAGPPKFDDPYKERAYLKGRLAAAFRIFGKYGFDEGVAGHITLRVCIPLLNPTSVYTSHNAKQFS
jgi:hypothetical protein